MSVFMINFFLTKQSVKARRINKSVEINSKSLDVSLFDRFFHKLLIFYNVFIRLLPCLCGTKLTIAHKRNNDDQKQKKEQKEMENKPASPFVQ